MNMLDMARTHLVPQHLLSSSFEDVDPHFGENIRTVRAKIVREFGQVKKAIYLLTMYSARCALASGAAGMV